jgi:formylglycine-generating enzyme required for sulfatase activity
MMGNVWEWNETLFTGSHRGLRGGAYYYYYSLNSSNRGDNTNPYYEALNLGFRVAEIPEPATLLLLGLSGLVLRRKH